MVFIEKQLVFNLEIRSKSASGDTHRVSVPGTEGCVMWLWVLTRKEGAITGPMELDHHLKSSSAAFGDKTTPNSVILGIFSKNK